MISQPDDAGSRTFLRCSFADLPFLVDAASVLEIRSAVAWEAEPGSDGLLGFVGEGASRIHGMTDLIDRTIDPSSAGAWLLLRGETPRALWVDRVGGESRVSVDQVLSMPEWIFRRSSRWFSALVRSGEELTPVFWPGRLGADPSDSPPAASPGLPDPPAGDAGDRLTLCAVTEPSPGVRPLTIGLSNRQVVEVVEATRTTRVPGLPKPMEGFFVWRDRLVPWVDLARWLRLPNAGPVDGKRLLVLRVPERREPFGFPVLPSVRLLALPVEHQRCRRRLPVADERLKAAIELWKETGQFPDFQKLTDVAE
jgi:chemotaxis signal transduction protein